MPEEPVAAPSSADAGAGSAPPTSGGDAAPSTPTVPVAAAPAAPAAAAPTTTERPIREAGEDPAAFLQRFHEWKSKQPAEGEAKPAEAKPTEETKPVEAAKSDEKKPEVKPPEPPKEPEFSLDELGPLPAQEVAQKLAEHPEAEKALADAGIDKEALFASLRLAAEVAPYKEIFPDVETAKFAHQQASAFADLDDSFTEIKDLPSTSKFISEKLLPLSFILGEDGQPMRDPTSGLPYTDGSVFKFLDNVSNVRLDYLEQQAKQLGGDAGEQLQIAVQVIRDFGKGGKSPASQEGLSEEVKQQAAEVDRRQSELDERENASAKQQHDEFEESVLTESSKEIDDAIGNILDQTSLKDDQFLRSTVVGKVREKLYEKLATDPMFKSYRDTLMRKGLSAETHKTRVAHNKRAAQGIIEGVMRPILKEAGAKRIERAQERTAKIDAQLKTSQMEPKGSASPAKPGAGQPVDKKELLKQAAENFRKEHNGQNPDTSELLKEYRKLQGLALTA